MRRRRGRRGGVEIRDGVGWMVVFAVVVGVVVMTESVEQHLLVVLFHAFQCHQGLEIT